MSDLTFRPHRQKVPKENRDEGEEKGCLHPS